VTYEKIDDYYGKRKNYVKNSMFEWRKTARGLNDVDV